MTQPNRAPVLTLNGVALDHAQHAVTVRGTVHHLTPMECRLLATLMQHAGEVLTRTFLMQEVWETDFTGDTRTLEVHISWLRKKIEADTTEPELIQTVHGVGYVFQAER